MSKVISRGECPRCSSSDAFTTFTEGPPKCFSCGYVHKSYPRGNKMEQYPKRDKAVDISLYSALPIRALTHKPIPVEICQRYGVRVGVDETTGDINRVYYPYHDDSNTITGYKVRKLPKEFVSEGQVSNTKLFGQNLFDDKQRKLLIITEGEDDALSVATMLKMRGKDYPVVSLIFGANLGEIKNDIKRNYEYIISHQDVMLCFDNDKVGKAYANLVAEFLCGSCNVKIVNIPEGYKDASDMLIAGLVEQFAKVMAGAKEFSPEAVVRGQDIDFDSLRKPKEKGYELPYPELQHKIKGLRKGELTLLTAGSGIGKSTLAREIAYYMVKQHNLTIGNIYLETPMEDAASAFIAMDNGVNPAKYWFNPSIVGESEAKHSYNELINSGHLHFFKHFGSIATDKLMSKLYYFAKTLACDFIVLDHISMVISGNEDRDERKSIDMLMTELAKFCVETQVGVIAVVHLKRVQGKNYNTGDEVELVDLRGSGGLEQMSWNVIGLERDQQGDTKDFSKIRVLKNRTFGYTGLADKLKYDHDSGRLTAIVEGYE